MKSWGSCTSKKLGRPRINRSEKTTTLKPSPEFFAESYFIPRIDPVS